MRIAEILRNKGGAVVTVSPTATVTELLAILAEHNIGAVVVSPDGAQIVGIASERDVVRRLHDRGAELLDAPVSEIMTTVLWTCSPKDRVESLQRTMTDHRVRHLPVLLDGVLVGIVSIGDVVKSAISELETERKHLVDYLRG